MGEQSNSPADFATIQRSSFLGVETTSGAERPQPPYMVQTRDFHYYGVRFDPDAVRSELPVAFEPLDDFSGVLGMYVSPSGWGLSPFSATFVAISVKEPVSPDGAPTVYLAEHVLDGPAEALLRDSYNRRIRNGSTRSWLEGDEAHAELSSGAGVELSISAKPDFEAELPPSSGVHFYIGDGEAGANRIFSIAFTAPFIPSLVTDFKMHEVASARLRRLTPIEFTWATWIRGSELGGVTFSSPSDFKPGLQDRFTAKAQQVGLLDLLSRMGHAAVLLRKDGTTLFLTPMARQLLADAHVGGKLRVARHSDQKVLNRIVSDGVSQTAQFSAPVAIEHPDGGIPLVARALPVPHVLAGEAAILVMFSDPSSSNSLDTATLLQVIGLTPAEARLSAKIGAGQGVKMCAESLGISEHTARSTLKVVYDKLGISKQTELAGIVARLG